MKIFNWVHRRFNNKAENVKKNGDIAVADEQQFLAEKECDVVFEGWRGGILAIGTFGYDPLKGENQQLNNGYFSEEDDDHSSLKDQSDDNGDNEGNPLVLASYGCDAGGLTETVTENLNDEDTDLQFEFEYVMMKKKERTTLADLFDADSVEDQCAIALNKPDSQRQKSSRKHAPSSARKLTAKDARPIHKLNKLMRRMLRRKVHPDVGPTDPKLAALINYNYNYNYNYKSRATDDCASLLPTQDIKISHE